MDDLFCKHIQSMYFWVYYLPDILENILESIKYKLLHYM